MRDIRFRAWDEQDKEMIQSFLPDWGNINQERYLLLQFTGLKDKNGKEIYEGDIIKMVFDDMLFQVIFDDVSHSFCIKSKKKKYKFGRTDNLEIIGNIYE